MTRRRPQPFLRPPSPASAHGLAGGPEMADSLPLRPVASMQGMVGGSSDYFAAMHGLPNGPQSVQDLSKWPVKLLRKALAGDAGLQKRRRLETVLQCGLVLHTDFSGQASVETTHKILSIAAERLGLHLPDGWLQLWRSTDNDRTCQRILLNDPNGAAHVLTGVLEILPPDEQKKIKALRPPSSASPDERKAAYQKLRTYLESNAKRIFPTSVCSGSCLRHPGGRCLLQWAPPPSSSVESRPLRANFSGPMCTPWSSHGKQEGEGSEDMESFHLWLRMMASSDLDLISLENSSLFPIDLFREPLQKQYDVVHVVFGSEDLGFPARRSRTYATAVNKRYLVWIGPTDPVAIEQEFLSLFQCITLMDGDSFVGIDTAENHMAHRKYLAQRRGIYGDTKDLAITDLLAPSNLSNWRNMREKYEANNYKVGLGGALIGDLSQSSNRQRLSPWFPSLARSTLNASISQSHVFTPAEVEFSMGWPVCQVGDASSYASCIPPEIERLSFHERAIRSGNGMNLAQVFAWVTFVYSHLVRRSDLERLMPPLRFKRPRVVAQLDGATSGAEDEGAKAQVQAPPPVQTAGVPLLSEVAGAASPLGDAGPCGDGSEGICGHPTPGPEDVLPTQGVQKSPELQPAQAPLSPAISGAARLFPDFPEELGSDVDVEV